MEDELSHNNVTEDSLIETERLLVDLYRKAPFQIRATVMVTLISANSPNIMRLFKKDDAPNNAKVIKYFLKQNLGREEMENTRTIVINDNKKILFNKFSEEQIQNIKDDLDKQVLSLTAIARKYKVSRNLIYKVKNLDEK